MPALSHAAAASEVDFTPGRRPDLESGIAFMEALEAERRTDTRTVHGFMTARIPARALLNARRVVRTTDQDASTPDLLEMAFETEIRVASGEHLGIDAPMSVVTRRATFFHCFVLEYIRTPLGRMALKAIVLA